MSIEAGTGFVDILPRTDKFLSGLNSQITRSISAASKGAATTSEKLVNGVTLGMVALAAGAVTAIGKGIQATTEWASGVRSLQKVTGQTAESASGLAGAAEHLGIGVDALGIGFKTLEKNVVTNATALASYGIITRDTAGQVLPFDELLGAVQDKFATLPTAADKTAFALAAFGKSGTALLPILAQGRQGLERLEEAARAAGLVMSQDDLDAAKALTLAQHDLSSAFKGASIAIGKSFVPVLTDAVTKATQIVEVISRIPQPVLATGLKFIVLTGAIAGVTKAAEFFTTTWGEVADTLGLVSDAATTVEASTTLLADGTRVAADAAVLTEKANAGLAASELGVAAANAVAKGSTASVIAADEAWAAANEATTLTIEQQIAQLRALAIARAEGSKAPPLGKIGVIAPLVGLAEAGRLGFQELQAALKGDAEGAARSVAQAFNEALGTNIDLTPDSDIDQFRTGVELVRTQLQSGAITADEASAAIDKLRASFHVKGDTDALVAAMGEVNAAIDATDSAIQAAGVSIEAGSESFRLLADISGETATEFRESFLTAFSDAADAAAKAGEGFDGTAEAEKAFAVASQDAMEQAKTSIADFRASATSDLLAFGNDALSGLADAAHLTVDKVTASFKKAAASTRSFGHDVLEISRTGGQAGKDLASQLLAMGPAAAGLASFIADAGGKAERSMIQHFGKIGSAAGKAAGKITDSIAGTLDDVRTILLAIADKWEVDVDLPGIKEHKKDTAELHHNLLQIGKPFTAIINANTKQAAAGLKFIKDQIADIEGVHRANIIISRDFRGGGGHAVGGALGGVIAGATGGVTHGPLLIGESQKMTFAGRGTEGLIPFDQRGQGLMTEFLTRALADVKVKGGDSPDIVVHVHNVYDGKQLSEVVTRHQQRGRMVRG